LRSRRGALPSCVACRSLGSASHETRRLRNVRAKVECRCVPAVDVHSSVELLTIGIVLVALVGCGNGSPGAADGGDSSAHSHDGSGDRHDAADAGSDVNLDAALSGFDVSPACRQCLGAHCANEANDCAMTKGCKIIETCALNCVNGGTAAMTCAVQCIEGEAGIPDAGALPAQSAAEELSVCIGESCSGDCI
jgi:hypothetical protein